MWEIFAYHNSEALAGIFNAIAAIMASGTYLSAVAAVAFCGFVAAMVAYMFQPDKLQGWKWIGTVVLIYGVLFVPRVTVAVVDKTGGTPNRIIANVPFGMAALGGLTSSIGNSITELFETAFQTLPGPASLPPELSYQQNGLMFGSRLIQEVRRTSIPDPAVRTDILNFVNNCTAFDIADGTISPTAFSQSADLWTMMAFTNPARFSTITTGAGVTTNTCDNVYLSINGRLPAQVNNLTARLAGRMNPSLPTLAAQAAIINQVPQAFIRGQISAAASTAADIIRQNALINAINDAGELGCQKINDPSCMMMATGRASAVASQNAAWINGAKIAEQALPVVRNVAEAMCYAVFPLVVLLLFLSSGRTTLTIISGYAVALISIQLWPPLFAILNYMATLYAQIDQAAAAELGGGVKALSLQTASPIYSNAVSAQAVVSYLIIGIPMLAYSLANRLANFGSAVMGGLQGLSSSSMSGSATAAAAVGNSNLGNVTMDQRNITPTTSNPWVTREQDDSGNWRTSDNHGRTAVELLQNKGITSQVVTARVTQDDVEAAAKTASAAQGEVVSAGTTQAATLREGMDRVRQRVNAARSNAGQGLAGYEEVARGFDQFWSEANRISKATGVDAGQVADTMLRFSMMPEAFGIGGGVAVGKRYNVSVSDTESKVLDHATQDTGKVSKSFGDRLTHDRSFLNTLSSEGKSGTSLASDLSTAGQRSDIAERRYSEAVSRLREVRTAYQLGYGYSRDIAADPVNSSAVLENERVAAQFRGSPQALAAHMASHLGNFSTTPARPTEDAGLPTGFDDVHSTFQRQSRDPQVNPDLFALRAANDGKVRSHRLGDPGAPASPSSPGLPPMPSTPGELPGSEGQTPQQFREHVVERGDAHRKNNDEWLGGFEKRQHLKRDSKGNLIVDYSLVGRSGSMFGADVYDTAAQAEAAARRATTTKEALGIDWVAYDEGHLAKNLFRHTKMARIAGLPLSNSQRAFDLFLKTRYTMSLYRGEHRGVVLATATPVANSMAEVHTFQRFLQPNTLRSLGLEQFDAWAATFGETVTALEIAPDGSGYRLNTRFARFINVPDLMTVFCDVSDIRTREMLKLPVPNLKGDKPRTVTCKPSEELRAFVRSLVKRAEKLKTERVDPKKDNMLLIAGEGRMAALDMRLINSRLPADPGGKVAQCAREVHNIWQATASLKRAQLVFCDLSTPKSGAAFSVYTALRDELIGRGIPAEQIAFIHDAETDSQKAKLFRQVREGKVRVLLGSTPKMGVGTNVQRRLVALHELDCPWRPCDVEQREGRILRQGNECDEVEIIRYVTEGSFDAYSWQTVLTKAKFIAQVMSGDKGIRSVEDVELATLTYAEVKALASGNPKIIEKAGVDAEIAKYASLLSVWRNQRYSNEMEVANLPMRIESNERLLAALEADAHRSTAAIAGDISVNVHGRTYRGRDAIGEVLRNVVRSARAGVSRSARDETIGSVGDFELCVFIGRDEDEVHLFVRGASSHDCRPCQTGPALFDALLRTLEGIGPHRDECADRLVRMRQKLEGLTAELQRPFEHEERLANLVVRQRELEAELDLGKDEVGSDAVDDVQEKIAA